MILIWSNNLSLDQSTISETTSCFKESSYCASHFLVFLWISSAWHDFFVFQNLAWSTFPLLIFIILSCWQQSVLSAVPLHVAALFHITNNASIMSEGREWCGRTAGRPAAVTVMSLLRWSHRHAAAAAAAAAGQPVWLYTDKGPIMQK